MTKYSMMLYDYPDAVYAFVSFLADNHSLLAFDIEKSSVEFMIYNRHQALTVAQFMEEIGLKSLLKKVKRYESV